MELPRQGQFRGRVGLAGVLIMVFGSWVHVCLPMGSCSKGQKSQSIFAIIRTMFHGRRSGAKKKRWDTAVPPLLLQRCDTRNACKLNAALATGGLTTLPWEARDVRGHG